MPGKQARPRLVESVDVAHWANDPSRPLRVIVEFTPYVTRNRAWQWNMRRALYRLVPNGEALTFEGNFAVLEVPYDQLDAWRERQGNLPELDAELYAIVNLRANIRDKVHVRTPDQNSHIPPFQVHVLTLFPLYDFDLTVVQNASGIVLAASFPPEEAGYGGHLMRAGGTSHRRECCHNFARLDVSGIDRWLLTPASRSAARTGWYSKPNSSAPRKNTYSCYANPC